MTRASRQLSLRLDPTACLLDEWPACLGAMVILSSINLPELVRAQKLDIRLREPETGESCSPKVFSTVTEQDLECLRQEGGQPRVETIRSFLNSLFTFEERFTGHPDHPTDPDYRYAVYSLIYLAKTELVAEFLLRAFVPLLRPGLWDASFRYKAGATFRDDVGHLLGDLEWMEDAGDHGVFDWYANLNPLADDRGAALLELAGLPPLKHPAFPPEDVWIYHTNVQPVGDDEHRRILRNFYKRQGYDL